MVTYSNKIPKHAKEYKKEYLLVRGINKELKDFIDKHLNRPSDNNLKYQERMKKYMKKFINFSRIDNFNFIYYDVKYIYNLNDYIYDFTYLYLVNLDNFNYKICRDFYETFCDFFNEIRKITKEKNIINYIKWNLY